jgi:hypothetical protein
MTLYENTLYVYVLLPMAAICMLFIFFPIGILFGILAIYYIYKHREPQRLALEAKQREENAWKQK